MEEVKPQGIPEEILKQEGSIDLFKWGILFVGGILAGIVVIVGALSVFGFQSPDVLNNVGILLATALVSLISGERISRSA